MGTNSVWCLGLSRCSGTSGRALKSWLSLETTWKSQWEVILTSVNALQPERLQLQTHFLQLSGGFVSRSLSPSVCQRGRGARKSWWIFPFWGDEFFKNGRQIFGRIFLTNFFLGVSAVSCTFGHEKKILHKIHHHICAAFGGCLKRAFPSTTHGSEAGTHHYLIKQLAQNLASNGEVPSLDGLCLLSLHADGSRF